MDLNVKNSLAYDRMTPFSYYHTVWVSNIIHIIFTLSPQIKEYDVKHIVLGCQ